MSELDDDDLCPLCMEPLDITDRNFIPCQCGYQVCLWCWHHIKENTNGLCPACRTPYADQPVVAAKLDRDELVKRSKQRKLKEKADKKSYKSTATIDRKSLNNIRVIQRNLVYVIGLPPSFAKEEVLRRHDFFGQYGKIVKVVINRTQVAGERGHGSASAYITFAKREDASRAIQAVDGFWLDGRLLRASFGTTKYCNYFLRHLPCNNPECLYLHELGEDEDSFTKEEMQAGKAMTGFKEHAIAQVYDRSSLPSAGKTVLPPAPSHISDSMLESDSKPLAVDVSEGIGSLYISASPNLGATPQGKGDSPSPPRLHAENVAMGSEYPALLPAPAPSKNPWGVSPSPAPQTALLPFAKPEEFPSLSRAASDSGRELRSDSRLEEKRAGPNNSRMSAIGSNKPKAPAAPGLATGISGESRFFGKGILATPGSTPETSPALRLGQNLGPTILPDSNGGSLYSHTAGSVGEASSTAKRAISPSERGKKLDPWALASGQGRAISPSKALGLDRPTGPVINLGTWNNPSPLGGSGEHGGGLDPEVVAVEELKPPTETLADFLRSELPGVPITSGRPPPSTSRFAFANADAEDDSEPPGFSPRKAAHSVSSSNRSIGNGLPKRSYGSDLAFMDPAIAMIQPRGQNGVRPPLISQNDQNNLALPLAPSPSPLASPSVGVNSFDRIASSSSALFTPGPSTSPHLPTNHVPDELAWLRQVLPNVRISADALYREPSHNALSLNPTNTRTAVWPSPPGYGPPPIPSSSNSVSLPFHDPAIVRAGLATPHGDSSLQQSFPPGMGRSHPPSASRYEFGRPAPGLVGNH